MDQIWSTETFAPIHVLHPYLETGAGDLFSLAWNPILRTIYVGCQNTSIQWFNFGQQAAQEQSSSGTSTPSRKIHKFFDSYPQYTHKPADLLANNLAYSPPLDKNIIEIPASNVLDSAHFGYVYCMAMMPSQRTGSGDTALQPDATYHLLTGSGDETVKVSQMLIRGATYSPLTRSGRALPLVPFYNIHLNATMAQSCLLQ